MMMGFGFSRGVGGTFDPAKLNLTAWFRASYGGSPWSGTASAGTSSSRALSAASGAPTVGTAVNGVTPAAFNGAQMIDQSVAGGCISQTAYSGWCLVNPSSLAAGKYIWFGASGTNGAALQADAATASLSHRDSGGQKLATVALVTSAWQLLAWRFDGSTLYMRTGSGAWQTVSAGSIATANTLVRLGQGASGGGYSGQILDFALSTAVFDDYTFDGVRRYCNSRYALAL